MKRIVNRPENNNPPGGLFNFFEATGAFIRPSAKFLVWAVLLGSPALPNLPSNDPTVSQPAAGSPAELDVLNDVAASGHSMILTGGETCPIGGDEVLATTYIPMGNQVLQAERSYRLGLPDGTRVVVYCGRSALGGGGGFAGTGLVAGQSSTLDLANGNGFDGSSVSGGNKVSI